MKESSKNKYNIRAKKNTLTEIHFHKSCLKCERSKTKPIFKDSKVFPSLTETRNSPHRPRAIRKTRANRQTTKPNIRLSLPSKQTKRNKTTTTKSHRELAAHRGFIHVIGDSRESIVAEPKAKRRSAEAASKPFCQRKLANNSNHNSGALKP